MLTAIPDRRIRLVVHDPDYLPNGRLNQCTALTTRGRRCKLPVFATQQHIPSGDGYATLSASAFKTMNLGVCRTHGDGR